MSKKKMQTVCLSALKITTKSIYYISLSICDQFTQFNLSLSIASVTDFFLCLLLHLLFFVGWDNFWRKKNTLQLEIAYMCAVFAVMVSTIQLYSMAQVFRFIWRCICKNCVKICDYNFTFSLQLLLFHLNAVCLFLFIYLQRNL